MFRFALGFSIWSLVVSVTVASGLAEAASVGSATATSAVEAATDNGPISSDADDKKSSELGEITVTAQRRSESRTNVPLSIFVEGGPELERQGITSTSDLSKVVPGLTFVSLGAWAQPAMRGISTTVTGPGNDNPIAIYLDGVYLGQQVGSQFELPDIERIEVLKGPQGTLFGRNATGGAIRIFTEAPSFTPTGSASVTTGFFTGADYSRSATDLNLKGHVSGPLSDTIAASASFHIEHTGGYLDDVVHDQAWGTVQDYGTRLKLLFKPADNMSFTLTGTFNKRDDELAAAAEVVGGLSAAAAYPGGIVATHPWQLSNDTLPDVKVRTWGTALNGEIVFGSGTLTTITAYTDIHDELQVDADGGASEQCLIVAACIQYASPSLDERDFQQEIYFASEKIGRFSYVVGANTYQSIGDQPSDINDFTNSSPYPSLLGTGPLVGFSVKVRTRAYAAFSELDYDVRDDLHVTLGGRLSYEKKVGYGAFTCCDTSSLPEFVEKGWTNFISRASLRYDTSAFTNVYATFSQGFKSGVVPYSNFSAPPANPEKINAYEVGFKEGGRVFPFSIAAFYYDYRDLQVSTFERVVSVVTNAASANIYGLDFDGTLRATSELSVRLGASWLPQAKFLHYQNAVGYNVPLGPAGLQQYTIDLSGQRLFKTPKVTATFSPTYTRDVHSGDLTTAVTAYYSSKFTYDADNLVESHPYLTINGEMSYRPSGSGVTVGVFARNLTNRVYAASASPGGGGAIVLYGPPREIGLSIKYGF